MKKRGFSRHMLIAFLLCLLTVVPLGASVDIGWEGVSFGLLVNKYQEELTTIRFVDLGDSSVDSMNISNGKGINDPQFRMVVSTNVRTKADGFIPIEINLTFEPFSLESSELSYDVRMFDVTGTPVKFGEGTSAVDIVHVSEETTVSFLPNVSPDGAMWTYEYPFAFSFEDSLEGAVAGAYSCNLIAEVVSIT